MPVGVCRLCNYIRPKANRICRGNFVEPKLLVRQGGHFVQVVYIDPMPTTITTLRWRLQREALNLYSVRVRVPQSLGSAIVDRLEEDMSVNHLLQRLGEVHRYSRAYAKALDSMGVLGAVERIINTERFKRKYGNSN